MISSLGIFVIFGEVEVSDIAVLEIIVLTVEYRSLRAEDSCYFIIYEEVVIVKL